MKLAFSSSFVLAFVTARGKMSRCMKTSVTRIFSNVIEWNYFFFFFFAAYLFLSRLTETITSRQRERNLKGPDSWKKIIIKIKKGLDLNHKQSIFYVTVHHCIRKDAHLTTDLSFRTFYINRFYSPQRRKEQILLFSLSLEAFSFSFIRILRL